MCVNVAASVAVARPVSQSVCLPVMMMAHLILNKRSVGKVAAPGQKQSRQVIGKRQWQRADSSTSTTVQSNDLTP